MKTKPASRGIFFICLGLFFASLAGLCQADQLEVAPVKLILSKQNPISLLVLRNPSSIPVVFDIKAYLWRQHAGKDAYTATHNLLVTPPIVTIPPKQKQIVRVGLRHRDNPADFIREQSYRLYLHEIPPHRKSTSSQLQIALNIGIPVFVKPEKSNKHLLVWHKKTTPDGKIKITATNKSNEHATVSKLSLLSKTKKTTLLQKKMFTYILPGQTREWLLSPKKPIALNQTILAAHSSFDDAISHKSAVG